MIKVIPAILSETKEDFEEKIGLLKGLVDWIQIDITDNSYYNFDIPFKIEAHILTKQKVQVDQVDADRIIIHQGEISWANKNYALVLAVEPGMVGGKFDKEKINIIKELRKNNSNIDIAVDGGVNSDNCGLIVQAGANILISNSFIFKDKNIKKNLHELQDCGFRSSGRRIA